MISFRWNNFVNDKHNVDPAKKYVLQSVTLSYQGSFENTEISSEVMCERIACIFVDLLILFVLLPNDNINAFRE